VSAMVEDSMKKVLLIAKRELMSYFGTWSAYVIASVVLFIQGVLFNSFAMGQAPKFSVEVLSDFFYIGSGLAMISGILLAMRLLAEEKQTGTITLFMTSPISSRSYIYGKFFAVLGMILFLQLVSLYMPALIFVHGKVSLGHIAAGYLVLLFLGAASAALTIFASVFSPNQLMAAVFGSVLLVTFLVLWMLADIVNEPFKEIFSFVAIHNRHFSSFAAGTLKLSDLTYYVTFIFFFLELSVQALDSRRRQG